jgi:hypothetical protein
VEDRPRVSEARELEAESTHWVSDGFISYASDEYRLTMHVRRCEEVMLTADLEPGRGRAEELGQAGFRLDI